MKNVTLLSIFMLTVQLWSFAQCDPKGITTDPDAPVNPEQPVKTNTFFDWRQLDYDMHQTINGISIPTTIPAPFNQIDNSNVLPLHGMEFRPEDGWELIARNLGYKDNGIPRTDLTNPYLVLYNRFSGRLRVFLAVGDKDEDHETAELLLKLDDRGNGSNRATLSHADNIMEPVKTFDPGIEIGSIQRFINEDNKWMTAEYQMAYDPCTCMDENKPILIDANLIDSARITLSGTLNGKVTHVEINNKKVTSSGITLKNATSFFKKAGKQVKDGTKLYNNLNSFLSETKDLMPISTPSNNNQQRVLNSFMEQSLEDLAKTAGGESSAVQGRIFGVGDFLKTGLKAIPYIGDALGLISSFIGGGSAPKGPQKVTFGPLAVDAKIEVSGHISSSNTFKTINFNMPGSTNLPANDLYPYYNEIMGIMNVLERPKIEQRVYTTEISGNDISDERDPNAYDQIVGSAFQLELTEDILYAVNPAPGFDLNKLDLLGALVFEVDGVVADESLVEVSEDVYRTPFLPLGCLKNYPATFTADPSQYIPNIKVKNVYFRIAAGLIRSDNLDAAPVIYSATYKTDVNPITAGDESILYTFVSPLPDLEGENIRIENRVLQPGEEVFATQSITIGPNVTVASGGTASLIAGASIIIEDDIQLDPKLDLRIDDPTPCKRNVPPATRAQVTAICQSNSYQERAGKRSESVVEETEPKTKLLTAPVAFPNPSNGQFTVRYELTKAAQEVSTKVLDITGRAVLTPFETSDKAAGFHEFKLEMDAFPTGFYSLILTIDGIPHTVKLVKE